MTRYTTTDVLICGAGVTGLTLAIELARHGVSFRLIEKRTTPFTGSRGKGIQPRTQEIFEDLGILNKVVAAGGLYPRLRTYRHDGSYVDSDIAHHTKPTHAEPYHLPLMVPQNVTETIMREQLKAWGHRVEFGCELRHFAQTPRLYARQKSAPGNRYPHRLHWFRRYCRGRHFRVAIAYQSERADLRRLYTCPWVCPGRDLGVKRPFHNITYHR